MLWRVCKGYTILSYAEVDESLTDLDTVSFKGFAKASCSNSLLDAATMSLMCVVLG